MVDKGALAAYGASFRLLGAQTAKLVVQVLHGVRPAELPIQTPQQLTLTLNLTTAKTIGLVLPRSVVERADRIVE
jgi:putative tryptophan/tyrosine transport system substrate-binding protein